MKVIRVEQFGDPSVLKLVEVPQPLPASGQVLVRVRAVGVNPVDTYIRAGIYPRKPPLPFTPGADAAGLIEAVGEGVTAFKVGDRVYTAGTLTGAYAEFALCEEAQVHPLPANVAFNQGAALGVPYSTAYYGLIQRGQALPGETVLVHGASGGVGTAAVQIARAFGMRVFGTAGTEKGLRHIEAQGAHRAFDHRAPDYLECIREATSGKGVEIILEMLANVNLGKDLGLLALRGRVVIVGSRGKVEIDPRDTMSRGSDIRGIMLGQALPAEMAAIHAALRAGLENHTLQPVIAREWPLAQAAESHRAVMETGAQGKIVLVT